MADNPPLNCLKCPSFCCYVGGYVQVSRNDIRQLAKHLGLTVRQFEEQHIIKVNEDGEKLIKNDNQACQFLGPNRRCTVYHARPRDCRGYNCWDWGNKLYRYARFAQVPIKKLRAMEKRR
jgi:Fe-S-cluster containining protein